MGWLTKKALLFFAIIIATGYLVSNFPDESILIGSIAIIIVIGIWMHQANQETVT